MTRVIIICLLAFMSVGSTTAQLSQIKDDPIDYSRIHIVREKGSHPVSYTCYHRSNDPIPVNIPITFPGELIRTRDLSRKIVEQAIQETLRDLGTTRARIKQLNGQIAQMRAVDYSNEQFFKDLVNAGGYGSFIILWTDMAGLTNQGEYGSQAANAGRAVADGVILGLAKGGKRFFGELLGRVVDLPEIWWRARERYYQNQKNKIAGYAAQELAKFYARLNENLKRLTSNEPVDWQIRVKGGRNLPFHYENVWCVQQWWLDMQLNKVRPLDPDDSYTGNTFVNTYEGVYLGWIEAEIRYEMASYDAKYLIDGPPDESTIAKISVLNNTTRMMANMFNLMAKKGGFSFTHIHRDTRAEATFRVPVNVTLRVGREYRPLIYGSMKLVETEADWIEGDLPELEADLIFQLDHSTDLYASDDEISLHNTTHEYVSDGYYYTKVHQDPDVKAKDAVEEFFRAIFRGVFTQHLDECKEVSYTMFTGTPIGTLQINLEQSLANEYYTRWDKP